MLAMIFSILLYILVAELVVSGRMLRMTGENDALLAQMVSQMDYTRLEVEDMLLTDLAGQAAAEEGGGGLGGALPGSGAGAAPPAATGDPSGGGAGGGGEEGLEGEEEADPAAGIDSSRDTWFEPQSRAENEITTYFWVEAENAKFNILSLLSPDEDWARNSRDQFVRLLDVLREDTEFDLPAGDAERIAQEFLDYCRRPGTERMPRPPLKSDDEVLRDWTLPLHLDELLLLPSVDEDLFYDKVLDGRVIPGLEAVLTVWTALRVDPGNPERNARIAAMEAARGETAEGGAGEAASPTTPAAVGQGEGSAATDPNDPNAPPPQPIGEGIRININLAPRAVLRALFPPEKVPDLVLDEIIRFRNEEDPEAADQQAEGDTAYEFGDLMLGESVPRKFFQSPQDLEQIPEFESIPDPQVKADFQAWTTTKSEVFSIHLATLFRRSEENRSYVLRRARTVVVRQDDGEDGSLYPIVRFEERQGLRVQCPDLQEESPDLVGVYAEMDAFAQEDRAWNPFLVDFYLPQYMREQFMTRR